MEIYDSSKFLTEKLIYNNGEKVSMRKKSKKKDQTVVGYMEMVTVDGVGDFVAKFDTGNGSVSSLHCDEYDIKDGLVTFKIGNKMLKSKLVGKSTVSNRNNETRPLVLIDLHFNGQEYKNVPFALVDRTKNYTKILLNRVLLNTFDVLVSTHKSFLVSKRPEGFSINKKDKYSGIVFQDLKESKSVNVAKQVVALRKYYNGKKVAVFLFDYFDRNGGEYGAFDGKEHTTKRMTKGFLNDTKDFYDEEFIESMKNHGYEDLTIVKLGNGFVKYVSDDEEREEIEVWYKDVLNIDGTWKDEYEEDGVVFHRQS